MENECAKAYELGWNDGYAEGYDDAEEDIKEGVTPDVYFVDGEEGISEEDYLEAINDSFDDGFDEGYSAGYAEGYMKAKKEEKHNGKFNGDKTEWLEISGQEFYKLVNSPEGKNRFFASSKDRSYETDECVFEVTHKKYLKGEIRMAEVTVINQGLMNGRALQRVAAYCRVSSNTADQHNSYARQIRVYTDMIKRNPNWEMVEIFADEGISGLSADKRPEFLRMVRMCELHKIDRIITKSVSRFARNVKEALEYVRKLKILGVGVQFEKEGIYTLSMGDEMLLNTFAAIAEEESVEISIRLRNANKKRMADGDFVDGNAPYGFRLRNRKLVAHEPEAGVVRKVFSNYISGCSAREIAQMLNAEGTPSRGKTKWTACAIRYMLKNEKYKGDFLCQKTYHTDVLPFKQKRNRGEEEQYYIEGSHKVLSVKLGEGHFVRKNAG